MVAPGGCAWLLRGEHAWLLQGACVVAPGGHAWFLRGGLCMVAPRGGMCGCSQGGHAWDTTRYRDTINERAVRILLECILVVTKLYLIFNMANTSQVVRILLAQSSEISLFHNSTEELHKSVEGKEIQICYRGLANVECNLQKQVLAASDYSNEVTIEPHNEMSCNANHPKIVGILGSSGILFTARNKNNLLNFQLTTFSTTESRCFRRHMSQLILRGIFQ